MGINGKQVFNTQNGVQYIIERYLTPGDVDDLRKMNNHYTEGRFNKELIKRLERGSGGKNWIPHNYEDELVNNASAIIGTSRRNARLKNNKSVDVYETKRGNDVYEDDRGKLRDFKTGRFTSKNIFED